MLTKSQEQFARCIVEGLNQTEAYRSAYPKNRSSDKTIWERASVLAKHPKVQERIKELRDELAKESIMTAQERLEWLTSIIKSENETTSDKLRASDQMNKMQGEYVQKVEASVNGDLNITIELTE